MRAEFISQGASSAGGNGSQKGPIVYLLHAEYLEQIEDKECCVGASDNPRHAREALHDATEDH